MLLDFLILTISWHPTGLLQPLLDSSYQQTICPFFSLIVFWRFIYHKGFSVFDKGIITRHLKNGANLHETAVIGETQSGGFFCDMAGAYWRPPCFGYQGGPQQTLAILPAKSKLSRSDFETKSPKAIVVPAHFCIGALVNILQSRPLSHEWERAGGYPRLDCQHLGVWNPLVSRVSGRVQRGVVCLYVLHPIRSTKANIDKAPKKQYNIGKICLFGFSKFFQNFCDLTDYFSSR